MSLLSLPPELLLQILSHLSVPDAKFLRLTSQPLARAAASRVFCALHSTGLLNLEATTESARRVNAILGSEYIAGFVRTIVLRPCLGGLGGGRGGDLRGRPGWGVEVDDDSEDGIVGYQGDFPSYEYGLDWVDLMNWPDVPLEVSTAFKQTIGRIGGFGNLGRVVVLHHLGVETPNSYETKAYRNTILRKVLRALNHHEHPATKLRSLAIENLHELVDFDILISNDFKAVMGRLETLELTFALFEKNEHVSPAPSGNRVEDRRERIFRAIDDRTRHQFFPRLRKFWLEPLQQNLVHLKLHSNAYWGYHPKLDLRTLHFPNLKSLALSKMTFTHDRQLDWILSHAGSLTLLSLDNCPIVHEIFVAGEIDHEGYPVVNSNGAVQWEGVDHDLHAKRRSYERRWHDFFKRFRDDLPFLTRFGFAHGPIDFRFASPSPSNGWCCLSPPPPDSPFEARSPDFEAESPNYSPTSPAYRSPSPDFQQASTSPYIPPSSEVHETDPADQIWIDFARQTSWLPARIHPFRYVAFWSGLKGRSKWMKAEGWNEYDGVPYTYAYGPSTFPRAGFPACLGEDQRGLEELLEVVKRRRGD